MPDDDEPIIIPDVPVEDRGRLNEGVQEPPQPPPSKPKD